MRGRGAGGRSAGVGEGRGAAEVSRESPYGAPPRGRPAAPSPQPRVGPHSPLSTPALSPPAPPRGPRFEPGGSYASRWGVKRGWPSLWRAVCALLRGNGVLPACPGWSPQIPGSLHREAGVLCWCARGDPPSAGRCASRRPPRPLPFPSAFFLRREPGGGAAGTEPWPWVGTSGAAGGDMGLSGQRARWRDKRRRSEQLLRGPVSVLF